MSFRWRTLRFATLVAVLAALFSISVLGEGLPLPPQRKYAIQHFGEQIGLENQTINSIIQDKQGFLWLGTQTGLFRFDGVHAVRYGTQDGLPSEWIDQLQLDPDGNLWAAYNQKGLARYNGHSFEPFKLPGDDVPRLMQMFDFDKKGMLWVATQNGVLRVDPKNPKDFQHWTKNEGLTETRTRALFIDRNETVWFASGNRLGRLRAPDYKVEMIADFSLNPKELVAAITMDGEGMIWVRTVKRLLRKEFASDRFVEDDKGIPPFFDSGYPTLDRAGRLMVPTVNGLFRRLNGKWVRFGKAEGLTNDSVIAAYQDNEGAIWLGLSGTGLDRWPDPDRWSAWAEEQGLPNNEVWGIVRDNQNRLWVGTSNGLAMWDGQGEKWRIWRERDGLLSDVVRSMEIDAQGNVWVLSQQGITFIDAASLRAVKVSLGKANNDPINIIHRGPDGKIWAGNFNSLRRLSMVGGHLVIEDIPVAPKYQYLTQSFAFSRDGTMWAGGLHGLGRWDGTNWQRFTQRDGLRSDFVLDLAPVNAKATWILYQEPAYGASLVKLDGSRINVTNYGKAEGLASDNAFMIGSDAAGRIWIGSEHGMSVLLPEGGVRQYNRTDGLIWDDVNSGAFWEDPDGSIYIGTTHGLARFQPTAAVELQEALKVYITGAKLGGVDNVGVKDPVAPYHRGFDVRFSALTFRDPGAVRCSYRLNGLESEYNETNLREARYPALPSGAYDFEVRCISGAGQASVPVHFSFSVKKAWWETWWARIVMICLAGLTVWLLVTMRTRALEQDRRRLEEAVAARSAELAAANKELEEASLTDPLTKVKNRRYLNSTIDSNLNQAIRAYERAQVGEHQDHRDMIFYLIDFDHFKEINDRFGHQAGDRLLVEIARRLGRIVRATDTLVRWGGEEFLIVSRDASRENAHVLAQRILEEVGTEPYDLGNGQSIGRTCSVGFVPFPWLVAVPEALKFEDVLRLADRGLYAAKEGGRNRAVGMLPASDVRELVELAKTDVRRTFFEVDDRFIRVKTVQGPQVGVPVPPI